MRTDPQSDNPYLSALPFYSQQKVAENDKVIDALLKERYAHVKTVLEKNKDKLTRLIDVGARGTCEA